MRNVQTILLDDIRAALIERVRCGIGASILESALAAWLADDDVFRLNGKKLIQGALSSERTPRETAALGILAQSNVLDDPTKDVLLAELRHLLGREPVVAGTPMPFCMDGLTLGGILLGIDVVSEPNLKAAADGWIKSCREVTSDGLGLGVWQETFLGDIAAHTGFLWPTSEEVSVVRVAMRSVGIGMAVDIESEDSDEQKALSAIRTGVPQDIECAEAIFRLACLDWLRWAIECNAFGVSTLRKL